MGGVLIDCADFTKALDWETWTNKLPEFQDKFFNSYYSKNFDRGIIGAKEFFDGISSDLDLTVSISRFLMEYRLLPKGFYPGAPELLKELAKNYTVACLSNTNELHWNKLLDVDNLDKYFKYKFPSHIIHEIKPDIEAYRAAIKGLNCHPNAIAFFDDREVNVYAAKKSGMNAFQVKNFKDLCDKIVSLEIL